MLLVGQDTPKVSYGEHRSDGQGWLTALRQEIGEKVDWSRIHALGKVPHNTLREIFRVSSAHVYLTYPFVLSWSLLEAMSCEALIIGSDTAPVREVIEHGRNGLLVPFNSSETLATKLIDVLKEPQKYNQMRAEGRKTITRRYDLQKSIKRQTALIDAVANGAIAAEYP